MVSRSRPLSRAHRCAALGVLLSVGGCATLSSTGSVTSVPSGPAREQTREQAGAGASASVALLEQSRREQADGSYGQAASSIERALRIDPTNPVLWLELGEIRLAEGDLAQAETLGSKALTLAAGDRRTEAQARRLIERVRCGAAC